MKRNIVKRLIALGLSVSMAAGTQLPVVAASDEAAGEATTAEGAAAEEGSTVAEGASEEGADDAGKVAPDEAGVERPVDPDDADGEGIGDDEDNKNGDISEASDTGDSSTDEAIEDSSLEASSESSSETEVSDGAENSDDLENPVQDYVDGAPSDIGEAPLPDNTPEDAATGSLYGDGGNYTIEEEESDTLSLDGTYRTKNEIWQYIKDHPSRQLSASEAYLKAPSMSKPYSAGVLKDTALTYAVNGVNQIRFAAGLEETALNDEYNMLAQAGSYLNAKNGVLSHYPSTPSGMSSDDELVINGKKGAGSSNIAFNFGSLSRSVFDGWLEDSDSNNIAVLGHRRWILEPGLTQTGFGHVGAYTSMYSFGYDNSLRNKGTIVAMPSRNMPLKWMTSSFAWNVSFGTYVNPDNIKVTLVRDRDNKTWRFSTKSHNGFFNVDNNYYGDQGCVIFRPSGISYSDGDTFTVTVEGAKDKPLVYSVDIFNAHGSEKPEKFPEEVSFTESKVELPVKAAYKLETSVLPAKANQKVTFSSSDPSVVSVSFDGTVTAEKVGSATITATTVQAGEDGLKRSADCTVTVIKPTLAPPTVIAPDPGKELQVGDEIVIRSNSNFEGSSIIYSIPQLGINDKVYKEPIVITKDMEGKQLSVTVFERCEGANDSERVSASYSVAATDKKGSIGQEDYDEVGGNIPDGIWVRGLATSYEYTGKAITVSGMRVYYKNRLLATNKDYTLKYTGNTNAGTARVTVVMKGDYYALSPVEYEFEITPLDLSDDQFAASDICLNVKKNKAGEAIAQKPFVALLRSGKKLSAKSGKLVNYEMNYFKSSDTGFAEPLGEISEAGDYVARFVGKGNYSGQRLVNIRLTDAVRLDTLKAGGYAKKVTYAYGLPGGIQAPDMAGFKLVSGKEEVSSDCYSISFENADKPGKAFIVVTAVDEVKDRYAGSLKLSYTIVGTPIKNAKFDYIKEFVYTGDNIKPDVTVTGKKNVFNPKTGVIEAVDSTLTSGTDYDVSYEGGLNVGTSKVVITGKNGFTGTVKLSYKIKARDLLKDPADAVITNNMGQIFGTPAPEYHYQKKGVKPSDLTVTIAGKKLAEGKDYTLRYSNNSRIAAYNSQNAAGKSTAPTVIVKLKGNYKGSITGTFSIIPKDISRLLYSIEDVPYKAAAGIYKSAPVIYDDGGNKLVAGTDYEKNIEYFYTEYTQVKRKAGNGYMPLYRAAGASVGSGDIIPVGTVLKAVVTGKGNFAKEVTGGDGVASYNFRICERSVKDITFKVDDFEYTGSAIRPGRVADSSNASGIHAHYTDIVGDSKASVDACADNSFVILSYSSNIKRGTGKITVRGNGRFAGTRTITFKIVKRGARKAQ